MKDNLVKLETKRLKALQKLSHINGVIAATKSFKEKDSKYCEICKKTFDTNKKYFWACNASPCPINLQGNN